MAKRTEPIRMLEIEKNLVISTSHITEEDFREIKKQAERDPTKVMKHPYLMVEDHTYGVIVILGAPDERSEMIKAMRKDFSEAFCNVLSLASAMEVSNVRFDEDGPEYDFLPTFEW